MSDYPKMLYKSGPSEDHNLWGVPLAIDGRDGVMHRTVANPDEEREAVSEGWRSNIDEAGEERPRRGRPPKDSVASNTETM